MLAELPPSRRQTAATQAVRSMIEEFRVGLFAQTLGTRGAVSGSAWSGPWTASAGSRPRAAGFGARDDEFAASSPVSFENHPTEGADCVHG